MSSDVRLIMNLIPDRSKHGGEKVPGTVNPNPAGKWTRCMTPGQIRQGNGQDA